MTPELTCGVCGRDWTTQGLGDTCRKCQSIRTALKVDHKKTFKKKQVFLRLTDDGKYALSLKATK